MKTILVDAIHTFVIKGEGIFEEMYELLETYPQRKIILTGANDEQMEEHGLHDMPYEVFTLKHDPEKTDPAYYEKMLDHFDLSAEEVVYFEHDLESAKVAEGFGIETFFYDTEEIDLVALKYFLDKSL